MYGNRTTDDATPIPEAIGSRVSTENRELAWTFFVFFAWMEYALKSSGTYLKAGTSDAQPNWDKLASDYDRVLNPDASTPLRRAVDYFVSNPPRKQLNNGRTLGWSPPQKHHGTEPLLIWLLRVVRYVWNILFHGGKFPRSSLMT